MRMEVKTTVSVLVLEVKLKLFIIRSPAEFHLFPTIKLALRHLINFYSFFFLDFFINLVGLKLGLQLGLEVRVGVGFGLVWFQHYTRCFRHYTRCLRHYTRWFYHHYIW
jgi:hypothetical protein